MLLSFSSDGIVEEPGVAPPKTPILFEDYSGRSFLGEAGALAVNDDWAITIYDYIRRFAPIIPTIPTPTGDPAKPGVSGVNPSAADEYLVIDRAGLVTALNNATYDLIFIAKGSDCTSGDLDVMTLTISGTAGTKRQFIYWDDITPSNVQDIKPWKLLQADRVQMPKIDHNSGSHTWFTGLSWGIVGTQQMRCAEILGTSSNNLYYRCSMENGKAHEVIINSANADDNMFFECVSHDHILGTVDIHCFSFLQGDNNRIVTCEGWDYLGDFLQLENGGPNGCFAEDCDIYRETFYDGAGVEDPDGDFGAGEGAFDFKNLNPAETTPCKTYGNRIWGMRRVDTVKHPAGGSGSPFQFSNAAVEKHLLDARWNIIFDSTDGAFDFANINEAAADGKHSIVRNIVSDIRTGADEVLSMPDHACEFYLNTVRDTLTAAALWNFARTDEDITPHDSMGNFYSDVGAINNQVRWGVNFKFGYNAWGGTFTKATAGYASDYENAAVPGRGSPWFMGDMTFIRKKMTGPELHTIPFIVPTTSTPSAFRTLVPISGGDQIGSRTGIGVDDLF